MHFCTLTAQKSTDKYCALYILGTILLENVIVVLYDMSRLSKQKSQAPGLARRERKFARELTRTRRIEDSADALRYGTTVKY
jgi:hypothetical protein